jgi:hypothetical protein
LLADAAPSGKPFTFNELLGRAEHIVERQHDSSLANRADLFTSIGRKYVGQDEDGKARRLLEQAYQISRGLPDPSPRARASSALGSALARSDLPRAESLIQEGLRELPSEPQFTLDRISCMLSGSAVARERGASQEAIGGVRRHETCSQHRPCDQRLLTCTCKWLWPSRIALPVSIATPFPHSNRHRL